MLRVINFSLNKFKILANDIKILLNSVFFSAYYTNEVVNLILVGKILTINKTINLRKIKSEKKTRKSKKFYSIQTSEYVLMIFPPWFF